MELFNHGVELRGKSSPSDWPALDKHDHMVGRDIPAIFLRVMSPVKMITSFNRALFGWEEVGEK